MTETQLQKSIMDSLQKMGVWVIRTAVSRKRGRGFTGEPGMPDLCLPVLGWAEVKLPGQKLRPEQVAWHERAKREGVRVAVWYSPRDALATVREWRHTPAVTPIWWP